MVSFVIPHSHFLEFVRTIGIYLCHTLPLCTGHCRAGSRCGGGSCDVVGTMYTTRLGLGYLLLRYRSACPCLLGHVETCQNRQQWRNLSQTRDIFRADAYFCIVCWWWALGCHAVLVGQWNFPLRDHLSTLYSGIRERSIRRNHQRSSVATTATTVTIRGNFKPRREP